MSKCTNCQDPGSGYYWGLWLCGYCVETLANDPDSLEAAVAAADVDTAAADRAPSHIRRELTVSGNPETVKAAVATWTAETADFGSGATVTETAGYWHGKREDGAVIRFDWPMADDSTAAFLWNTLIDTLAAAIPLERFGHETAYRISFRELNFAAVRADGRSAAEAAAADYASSRYGSGRPAAASGDTAAAYWRR